MEPAPTKAPSQSTLELFEFPAAWWAVARISLRRPLRSVSGVWSEAATAKAAVMPGTISKGMWAFAESFDLFVGAAEDERVAGFEAEDGAAVSAGRGGA